MTNYRQKIPNYTNKKFSKINIYSKMLKVYAKFYCLNETITETDLILFKAAAKIINIEAVKLVVTNIERFDICLRSPQLPDTIDSYFEDYLKFIEEIFYLKILEPLKAVPAVSSPINKIMHAIENGEINCLNIKSIDDFLLTIVQFMSRKMPRQELNFAEVDRSEVIKLVNDLLVSCLTNKESVILISYFGLNGSKMTLDSIGVQYKLSKQRIYQMKEKAIRKLRRSQTRKILLASLSSYYKMELLSHDLTELESKYLNLVSFISRLNKIDDTTNTLLIKVADIDFSVRAHNILWAEKISYLYELS